MAARPLGLPLRTLKELPKKRKDYEKKRTRTNRNRRGKLLEKLRRGNARPRRRLATKHELPSSGNGSGSATRRNARLKGATRNARPSGAPRTRSATPRRARATTSAAPMNACARRSA